MWGGQPKRQPEPKSQVNHHEQKMYALEQHFETEVGSAQRTPRSLAVAWQELSGIPRGRTESGATMRNSVIVHINNTTRA